MFESERDYAKNIDDLIAHLAYEKKRGKFLKNIVKKYNCESAIKDEIKQHLSGTESVSLINSKKFTYNNSIISLYGFLENYLESIIKEFIGNLNKLNSPFGALPKEIRELHLESSIELLKKIQRNRVDSKDQKNGLIKSVVRNMNSCIQEDKCYQLNEEAFSIHTSNFRYDAIHNIFCKIGIQGLPKKSLRNDKLKVAIANKHTIDSNVDQKILVSLLTSELDDLAQRRNEIAHGSFDGDLESIDLVIERALLLKIFGYAINKILTNYYYEFVFVSSPKVSLGLPEKTFSGINVLGFSGISDMDDKIETTVSVGDMVFALNENSAERLKYGSIISIEINGKATETLKIPNTMDFALKVDFDLTSHISKREIFCAGER